MTETGQKKIDALVREGEYEIERQAVNKGDLDPAPGKARDGIQPGQWEPDRLGLPPGCPVQPLGKDGEYIFLVDADGQLQRIAPNAFGQTPIQMLFGNRQDFLYWAWPKTNKSGVIDGWRAEKVREDFYAAASRKGLWKSVEKVRGLGAWSGRKGELILHCGEALVVDGELRPTGEIDGYFYPRRPLTFLPSRDPVDDDDNPAHQVLDILRTWSWSRPIVDPLLMFGWICSALLGGALPWRPSMFLVGDKGTGKSSLQEVIKAILGEAIVSTPDTTPAGIYQRIGTDALPIAVDELEADADNRRVMAVVKLARLAASGGLMLRGGQDHKGIEFQARSPFLFSAINRPPMPAQDLSRIAILSIGKLDQAVLKRAPTLGDPESVAPRLLRRLSDGWRGFPRLFDQYRDVLRAGGHDSRGQDTYGIFLACAHLALGDEGMEAEDYPMEDLAPWSKLLAAVNLTELEEATENWRACMTHLLTSRVEAWRHGQRQTVGALLDDLADDRGDMTPEFCRKELAQAGLGLLFKNNPVQKGSYVLAVPNSGPLVAALFRGTPWGGEGHIGVWGSALKQGPPHVFRSSKDISRARINGAQVRCTMIVLNDWEDLDD